MERWAVVLLGGVWRVVEHGGEQWRLREFGVIAPSREQALRMAGAFASKKSVPFGTVPLDTAPGVRTVADTSGATEYGSADVGVPSAAPRSLPVNPTEILPPPCKWHVNGRTRALLELVRESIGVPGTRFIEDAVVAAVAREAAERDQAFRDQAERIINAP